MIFLASFIISLTIIIILTSIFKREAFFWCDKIFSRFKKEGFKEKKEQRGEPIEKYCGFRDWSEEGGEICALFQLEDGSEYKVTEDICRKCIVWDRYEAWQESGKKEDLSVILAHTFKGSKPMVVETDKLNPEMDKGLKFDDFVIRRRRVPWAGKAAIASLTLITYLIIYFSGVFSDPVVRAMPDTFYFYDEGGKAAANNWNMRAADPSSAADTSTKCVLDQATDTNKACALYPGATRSTWEAAYEGPKKRGWMTDNDSLLEGTIASGNWTTYMKYNFVTNEECIYGNNKLAYRFWKADADLSNPTRLSNAAGWDSINISAGTNTGSHAYNPGAVTLDNQVLLIEFRWYVSYTCFGNPPNDTLTFYVDEGGATEKLDTPVYAPVPENSLFLAAIVPFVPLVIKRYKLKKYLGK